MPRERKQRNGDGDASQEPEAAPRVITPDNATDDELRQLEAAKDRVAVLRLKRAAINDDIAKERKKLRASGWNLAGFDLGCQLADMDPAKRRAVDVTLHLTRRALDIPADLFAAAGVDDTAGAASSHATH